MQDVIPFGNVDDMASEPLKDLARYWLGLHQGGQRPSRADIDPVAIRHVLPFLMIAEVHDPVTRIRFRLIGTDITLGTDVTGTVLQENPMREPYRAHILDLYAKGATSRAGLFSSVDYGYTQKTGPANIQRLFLPIAGNSTVREMLLIGQVRDRSVFAEDAAWEIGPGHIEERLLFRLREGEDVLAT